MPRHIDAYKLCDIIDEWIDTVGNVIIGKDLSYYAELKGCIEDTPTADVQEVKHGKWKEHKKGGRYCSSCKNHHALGDIRLIQQSVKLTKYCPYCGAKMDLEE